MNWFGQESSREMRDSTQTAGPALFLQFESDSEMEGVLKAKGSCISLVVLCEMCLITLFLCSFADMEVGMSYAMFLLT